MRKFFYLALAALAVSAVSCKEEVKAPDELNFDSVAEIVAESTGYSTNVTFNTNNAWNATVSADWVSINPASGEAGDGKIDIEIAPNNSDKREATLTVNAGSKKQEIKISQKGVSTVAGEFKDVPFDGGSFELACDGSANADVDWISAVVNNGKAVITVAANEGLEVRTGKVVVVNGGVSTEYTFNQTFQAGRMNIKRVVYLKNSADVYDDENWCLSQFNQYALVFDSAEGEVTIVVNAPAQADAFAGVPAGTYEVDAAADHSDYTFSVKSLDGGEKYFTCIGDVVVADGEVEITADGVNAILVDGNEAQHEFSFVGAFPEVEDESYGVELNVSTIGNYYTYFASNAFGYNVTMYLSAPACSDKSYVYMLGFALYGDETTGGIPTGTFTFDDSEDYIDYPSNNGTQDIKKGALRGQTGYADYDFETGGYNEVAITGGSATVSKNDDGTYNFNLNLNVKVQKHVLDEEGYWAYDEDWNYLYEVIDEFTYAKNIENVKIASYTDDAQVPTPDGGGVIPLPTISANYNGMWFGKDVSKEGNNTIALQWTYCGAYNVSVTINTAGDWTFTDNIRTNYCSTPVPDGKYTFAATEPADNCIINPSKKNYSNISNGYTGTVYYITGGSLTFADGKVSFDLYGTPTGGEEAHFTGGWATTATAIRNLSTKPATYSPYYLY